jgi:hypothetical protein
VAGTAAPAEIEASIDALVAEGLTALQALSDDGSPLIAPEAAANLRRLALAASARDR